MPNSPSPHFYMKVSREPFDFDLERHQAKYSWKTDQSVFLTNNPKIKYSNENGLIKVNIGVPDQSTGQPTSQFIAGLPSIEISWDERISKNLTVRLDKYGLGNIFYYETAKSLYLSNKIDLLARALEKPELSRFAVSFFLVSGFLPAGISFWSGIRRIMSQSSWSFSSRQIVSRHGENQAWESSHILKSSRDRQFTNSEKDELAQHAMECLRQANNAIAKDLKPQYMALSGGADTRLVASLWDHQTHPLKFRVIQSPWIEEGRDLDVNIATQWANLLRLHLEIEKPTLQEFSFFGNWSDGPLVSGLCGGEFLGGEFLNGIPSNPSGWEKNARTLLSKSSYETVFDHPWVKKALVDESFWMSESVRVFLQSTRTVIYQSFFQSWSEPYELHNFALSPFVSGAFLDLFLKNPRLFKNYEIYKRAFSFLKSPAGHLPLSSPLTEFLPELKPQTELGEDPKKTVS